MQMPRKQGIGMRRPKKSKPAVVDEAVIEQSVDNAIEAAATIVGDAIPSDPQVIQSDEFTSTTSRISRQHRIGQKCGTRPHVTRSGRARSTTRRWTLLPSLLGACMMRNVSEF